jgi:hypothetical protein
MSIDSVFVHKMWNDNELSKMVKGGVPFPMLSDAGGKVGSIFGVYDDQAGVETRGRFIIDPDGVIQGYEVLTPPVGRNVLKHCRQLQAFQVVRNSKGAEATAVGLATGKNDPETGTGPCGKGLGGLENRKWLLIEPYLSRLSISKSATERLPGSNGCPSVAFMLFKQGQGNEDPAFFLSIRAAP